MRTIAIDTETSGLDPMRDNLRSIQTYEKNKGKCLQNKSDWLKLKPVLENYKVLKIIHNAVFDMPFIQNHTGIRVTNVWDTKLAESVILGVGVQRDPAIKDQYSTSLKAVLKRRYDIELDKSIQTTFVGGSGKFTKEQTEYAIDDVRYLEQLMNDQIADLNRLNLMGVANLEMKVVEVTSHMKLVGIGFDVKVWLKLANEYSDKYSSVLSGMPSHINWNSPKQIKDFFGRKGIQIDSLSDIDEMTGIHPALDQLLELRKYYKYSTTYGEGWLTDKAGRTTVHGDDRVRCDFEQIIQTGRFSCSNPNLQQLPNGKATDHRKAFVPKKGYKFVIGDFTGQELGIMAAGAGEQSWIDAMTNNEDVHSVMGRLLYKDVWDNAATDFCEYPLKCSCPGHKPLRRNAKDLNFGLAYGKGPKALAIDLGLTDQAAYRLIDQYKKTIPKITRWLTANGNYAVVHKKTYTLPPYSRYRSLELEPEEWRRRNQGKNTPVQGTGGDMIKLAMVKMYQYIIDNDCPVNIVLIIHDEIITEVASGYAAKWRLKMKELMEEASMEILKYPVVKTDPYICTYWEKLD